MFTWDWRRLPPTTSAQDATKPRRKVEHGVQQLQDVFNSNKTAYTIRRGFFSFGMALAPKSSKTCTVQYSRASVIAPFQECGTYGLFVLIRINFCTALASISSMRRPYRTLTNSTLTNSINSTLQYSTAHSNRRRTMLREQSGSNSTAVARRASCYVCVRGAVPTDGTHASFTIILKPRSTHNNQPCAVETGVHLGRC